MNNLPKPKITRTAVNESTFGVYVWEINGQFVADEDGNWLNIPSEKGDLVKIMKLTATAFHYGLKEGKALFLPGRRRVTDDELEEQKQRLAMGLTPDIYDAGALLDELNFDGKMNK